MPFGVVVLLCNVEHVHGAEIDCNCKASGTKSQHTHMPTNDVTTSAIHGANNYDHECNDVFVPIQF